MAISTSILAAGCSISSNLRMVAPSFDIVVSFVVVIILSMPRGPVLGVNHTESSFDNIDDGFNSVNIRDDLPNALHGIGSISEQKNGWLLSQI